MSSGSGDDADGWAAAARGDGEAYGRVFDRHRDRVRRHAVRLVPPEVEVDDVVAVVFLEAWRRRRRPAGHRGPGRRGEVRAGREARATRPRRSGSRR